MLGKINHPNIIKMKAAWADKEYYYLLLPYQVNGDLSKFMY